MKSVNSLAPKSTSSARPVLIEEIEAMNAPIRKVSSVILISIKQKTYFKWTGSRARLKYFENKEKF